MTEEQRLAWEKQQGFTSFATKSKEVYAHVAEKELSIDELKKEIVKYNNLLSLKSDTNSDYVLEHALESTPKRFLCNADRIFKIGNTLYKVFENNIVMCNEKHYTKLLSLNESNYIEYTGDDFQLMFSTSELKDDEYKVPLSSIYKLNNVDRYLLERRNDNGSNRTRLRIGIDFIDNGLIYPVLWGEAKPYKRVLGVWYETSRTISCEYNIKYDYTDFYGTWYRSQNLFYNNTGTNTTGIYKILKTFDAGHIDPMVFFSKIHIAATKCWAKTPDTGRAEIFHNEELID